MDDSPESHERLSLMAEVARSLREWINKYAPLRELDRCGCAEVARIARDLRITESDLGAIALQPADSANLLYRRLAGLGLDPADLERKHPAVFHDLQHHCSMCVSKKQCGRELSARAPGSAWSDYCPNAYTLRALIAERPEPESIDDLIDYLNLVGAGRRGGQATNQNGGRYARRRLM